VTRPWPRAGRTGVLDQLAAPLARPDRSFSSRDEASMPHAPAPATVDQFFGLVPALAPMPEQASHVTETGISICAVCRRKASSS